MTAKRPSAHETALRNVLRMCQETRLGYNIDHPEYCDSVMQIRAILAYVRGVLKLEGELL